MEGKRGETPPNTGQQEENIASESRDEPETSEGQSLSTAPGSTIQRGDEPIGSNERALSGRYFGLQTASS